MEWVLRGTWKLPDNDRGSNDQKWEKVEENEEGYTEEKRMWSVFNNENILQIKMKTIFKIHLKISTWYGQDVENIDWWAYGNIYFIRWHIWKKNRKI